MSETNELLDIYNDYIVAVAKGYFEVLKLASDQALLQGLDDIQAIELTIAYSGSESNLN